MKRILFFLFLIVLGFCFSVEANSIYQKKVDNFVILIDMSGSMGWTYPGASKKKSKMVFEALKTMKNFIPNLDYKYSVYQVCGLKSYLKNRNYSKESFSNFLNQIEKKLVNKSIFGPPTTLGEGLLGIDRDLKTFSGKTAIILFSDGGQNSGVSPVDAAKKVYMDNNKMVCFYVVSYATKPKEKEILRKIADIGGCGKIIDAKDAMCPMKLKGFVEDALIKKVLDSDGDGVVDSMDWCPKTPAGVKVDKDGCPYDSDGDGVYDYMDKCPNTPKQYRVDEFGCPIPLKLTYHINFKSNSAKIDPKYFNILDKIGRMLVENPKSKVTVAGHTDSIGSAKYNQKLSQKRAEAIKNYLITKFNIQPKRIKAIGFGESMPVADNHTLEGRMLNRRVEFYFKGLYEMRNN